MAGIGELDDGLGSEMGNEFEEDIGGVPAFCLKTRDTKTQRKVFLNFCHNREIPKPAMDLTEEQFRELLQSNDADKFKIPLLCKSLYYTKDKSGNDNAVVADVIINTDFYKQNIKNSELFKTFLVTVALEIVEQKFENDEEYEVVNGWSLSKENWTILKNKKYQPPLNPVRMPKIKPQESQSLILDPASNLIDKLGLGEADGKLKKIKIFDHDSEDNEEPLLKPTIVRPAKRPPCTTIKFELAPDQGTLWLHPKKRQLVFEQSLPQITHSDDIVVELNDDHLKIESKQGKQFSNIFLPVEIDSDSVQPPIFDPETHQLKLTMPLKPSS